MSRVTEDDIKASCGHGDNNYTQWLITTKAMQDMEERLENIEKKLDEVLSLLGDFQ